MENTSKSFHIRTTRKNDDLMKRQSVNNSVHKSNSVCRSTILPSTIATNVNVNVSYVDIDKICLNPSPIDTIPRLFQAGTLFNSNTYERILSIVYNQQKVYDKDDKEESYDSDDHSKDNISNEKQIFDQKQLINERTQEIQHLTQIIRDDQPANDYFASSMMQQLDDVLGITLINANNNAQNESEICSSVSTTYHYPPIIQTGPIIDHDRPYADYGHLDGKTIAEECNFNLKCIHPNTTPKSPRTKIRMSNKSFAITSWTTVSKETVMREIKRQFTIEQLQYVCIAQEIGNQNATPHLHIQIILKKVANKKTWFLDDITGTHCNYQVTKNDRAWNEYIKKGLNFIEFGSFKSTTAWAPRQWSTHSTTTSAVAQQQTEERRQHEKEVARQALELAKTNVHHAMDLLQNSKPEKFLSHSSWYLSTFNYVYLRAQRETDRTRKIDKEYVWPISFPDCTPKLREAVNQWIRHHFSRTKRAKCLILIGPTGCGKTSFALSLPGHVNYFKGRWNLEKWNDYARYSVYDDVPWDDFVKFNYPDKKGLLTQNGQMNATDKYRGTREINVRQPAIVLLNPEDAGSLTTEPITTNEQQTVNYWKKRAFIYIMDSNEYFYKKQQQQQITTNTNDNQISSNSSIDPNDDRIGEPDEFDEMIQHYYQKKQHSKR